MRVLGSHHEEMPRMSVSQISYVSRLWQLHLMQCSHCSDISVGVKRYSVLV